MVGWIFSGPGILLRERSYYMRRIGYFSDPVLIIRIRGHYTEWRDSIFNYRKIHTKT